VRLVPVSFIKEGNVLAQTLYDTEGRILLNKGITLNNRLLKRVMENGIYSLYINDELSVNEIDDIIKPQVRLKAVKAVRDTIDSFISCHRELETGNKHRRLRLLDERCQKLSRLAYISNNIVDEILGQKNIMISLANIKKADSYTYEHSVNVAILALVLGVELGLSKDQLYDLCMGSLLHDLGKVFIPERILQKKGKLNEQEYNIVKKHSVLGYNHIKSDYSIHTAIKLVVLQHHERVDGLGYPYGLAGDKISDLAKISAIADVYDALSSDRCYRPAYSNNEAIEYIMGGAGTLFDYEMTRVFARKIVPYPVGTLVELSSGQVGVIERYNLNFPLRPVVRIINANSESMDGMLIDLMEDSNITIQRTLYELPEPGQPGLDGKNKSYIEVRLRQPG
jgi:HD-GYP domain-containing protein (c-di-GMP phosphodiesterase class II)